MKAVICPVCNGEGKIGDDLASTNIRICHGCGGRGWVEVKEETGEKDGK